MSMPTVFCQRQEPILCAQRIFSFGYGLMDDPPLFSVEFYFVLVLRCYAVLGSLKVRDNHHRWQSGNTSLFATKQETKSVKIVFSSGYPTFSYRACLLVQGECQFFIFDMQIPIGQIFFHARHKFKRKVAP